MAASGILQIDFQITDQNEVRKLWLNWKDVKTVARRFPLDHEALNIVLSMPYACN